MRYYITGCCTPIYHISHVSLSVFGFATRYFSEFNPRCMSARSTWPPLYATKNVSSVEKKETELENAEVG